MAGEGEAGPPTPHPSLFSGLQFRAQPKGWPDCLALRWQKELTLAVGLWACEWSRAPRDRHSCSWDQEVGVAPCLAEGPSLPLELTFKEKTSSFSGVVPCCLPSAGAVDSSRLLGAEPGTSSTCGMEAPHQQLPDHTRWGSGWYLGLVGRNYQ